MNIDKIFQHLHTARYELRKLADEAISDHRRESLEQDIQAIREAEKLIKKASAMKNSHLLTGEGIARNERDTNAT